MRNATKVYDRYVGVRLSWIILFILLALSFYSGWEFYHGKLEEHTPLCLVASLQA